MGGSFEVDDVELQGILERFKVFLAKLEQRALELEDETVQAAQEISDYDEIRYHHFRVGIKGQYNELVKKAKEIFKTQIKKKSYRETSYYKEIHFDDNVIAFERKINDAEILLDDFEERIGLILENIFKKVKVLSPKQKLEVLLEEYEETKEKFCCQQCGAKLKLNQVYFVSPYITCEFCQTQNTFIPSMRLSLLPDLVREIADQSTGDLEYPVKGNNLYEQFIRFEDHSRRQYFIKKKLIHQLSESYKDIFVRGINDYLQGKDFDEVSFNQILNHYGKSYINKLLDDYKLKSVDKSIDKKLNELEKIQIQIILNQCVINLKTFEDSDLKKSIQVELIESENEIKSIIENLK